METSRHAAAAKYHSERKPHPKRILSDGFLKRLFLEYKLGPRSRPTRIRLKQAEERKKNLKK